MRVISTLTALFLVALHGIAAEPALLTAGQYAGTVKMIRHVSRTGETSGPRADDLIITTTAKAVASVSDAGDITLVIATPQNPVPGNSAGNDVLKGKINRESFAYTVQQSLVTLNYTGKVKAQGNAFELTYDDIPFISMSASVDESGFTNGPGIVARSVPASFTEFSYRFRRVGP